ncbi:MAG TPA: hypothetical protein PLA50_08150 [Bacteroidia bacterium]|nr:hypothetical protein [Bacteroidia bacterium]
MKLPIRTVCMVFGVTLVHLLVIVAISPRGGETILGASSMDDARVMEISTGNPTPEPEPKVAPEPMAAAEEEARGVREEMPVDLPARLRPLPDAEAPAVREPLAESADATALRAPGRIGPMPQS